MKQSAHGLQEKERVLNEFRQIDATVSNENVEHFRSGNGKKRDNLWHEKAMFGNSGQKIEVCSITLELKASTKSVGPNITKTLRKERGNQYQNIEPGCVCNRISEKPICINAN